MVTFEIPATMIIWLIIDMWSKHPVIFFGLCLLGLSVAIMIVGEFLAAHDSEMQRKIEPVENLMVVFGCLAIILGAITEILLQNNFVIT